MIEKIGSFGTISFVISFVLGSICLFHILKTLLLKKVSLKFLSDSMGESSSEKSTVILICSILGIFAACFYSVCFGIIIFAYKYL